MVSRSRRISGVVHTGKHTHTHRGGNGFCGVPVKGEGIGPLGGTVVLQWCYSSVTVVLQWCYSGVTVVL
jgi:hypothetical protein